MKAIKALALGVFVLCGSFTHAMEIMVDDPSTLENRLKPEEVRSLIEYIYQFLPEGRYIGKLDNGQACKVEVKPGSEQFKDLVVMMKAPRQGDFAPVTLQFKLNSFLALKVILVNTEKNRLSVETQSEAAAHPPLVSTSITHFSLSFDDNKKPTALYLFEELKSGQGIAHAQCEFETYEPL